MTNKLFANRRAAFHFGMQALMASFGGVTSLGFVIIVVLSVIAIGWFSDELFSLVPEVYKIATLLPLLLLLLLFSLFSRLSLKLVAPSISQHGIRPCEALIWFLSPPGFNQNQNKKCSGDETHPEDMSNWRMAYEAITKHQGQKPLKAVIVIPSSDTDDKQDGTYCFMSRFLSSMSEATGVSEDCFKQLPEYELGVDFEGAEDLYKAVEAAYEVLDSLGIKENDVVLDITGGQKLPGAIGGIAGLGEGRRFQYVSTRNYRIQEYHITYKVAS